MFVVKTIKLPRKFHKPLVQYADEWRMKIHSTHRSLNLGLGFRWTATGSWL
jgi:hypothetical protein